MSFPIPKILTHPNIPKPLHGVNPRSVLGDLWWDHHRKEAYAKHDDRCWACGIHKKRADWHQWLEGHEFYDINYSAGTVELVEIVALCHSCHNFIHSGRLWALLEKGEISEFKWHVIMKRGIEICKHAGIRPWWGSLMFWYMGTRQVASESAAIERACMEGTVYHNENKFAPWNQWRLIIDGDEYYSKFASQLEWDKHYNGG